MSRFAGRHRCLPCGLPPAWVVASGLYAGLCATTPATARAQSQTCATPANCAVPSAACINGFCRLSTPEPLIASLSLGTIDLVEPAGRALLTGGQPDLRFTYPAGAASVAVAITDEPPVYDPQGNLYNTSHIVWYWSSLFEGLVTGVVSYAKGRLIDSRDMTCVDRAPAALGPGIYYWAALGRSADGTLSHQSELRAFSVGPERLSGKFCNDVGDCGRAGFAACADPNHYCVLRCASDRDCFAGTSCDLSTVGTVVGFEWGVCRPPGPPCACTAAERCDDIGPGALHVCYRPTNAGQSEAGCDCGGSSSQPVNTCYAAMAGVILIRRRRRLLRSDRTT